MYIKLLMKLIIKKTISYNSASFVLSSRKNHKHPQLIELAEQIREVSKLTPSVGFNVAVCGTSVTLYPLGAEILDEGTVNKVLGWLQS